MVIVCWWNLCKTLFFYTLIVTYTLQLLWCDFNVLFIVMDIIMNIMWNTYWISMDSKESMSYKWFLSAVHSSKNIMWKTYSHSKDYKVSMSYHETIIFEWYAFYHEYYSKNGIFLSAECIGTWYNHLRHSVLVSIRNVPILLLCAHIGLLASWSTNNITMFVLP